MSTPFSFSYKDLLITVAQKHHGDEILALTNDAFMADSFFKKKEFFNRLEVSDVKAILEGPQSVFLIASQQKTADTSTFIDTSIGGDDNPILGSVHVYWKVVKEPKLRVVGSFSAVSVPTRNGRRGIGKGLVQAAESFVREVSAVENVKQREELLRSSSSSSNSNGSGNDNSYDVFMEMGVVNARTDLFPWYEAQGYAIPAEGGEMKPNHPDFQKLLNREHEDSVFCILMRKELLAKPLESEQG